MKVWFVEQRFNDPYGWLPVKYQVTREQARAWARWLKKQEPRGRVRVRKYVREVLK